MDIIKTYPEGHPRIETENEHIVSGSPLAMIGLFVFIVRARFKEGIYNPLPWIWIENFNSEPTITGTKLQVESSYAKGVARNYRPSIFVGKRSTIPQKNVIGNKVGTSIHKQIVGYHSMASLPIIINCKADLDTESALIAETVWFHILGGADVIRKEFAIHDISPPILGETIPVQEDQEAFQTPVTFTIQYDLRWYTQQILPTLREFRQEIVKASNPDAVLISLATREDITED